MICTAVTLRVPRIDWITHWLYPSLLSLNPSAAADVPTLATNNKMLATVHVKAFRMRLFLFIFFSVFVKAASGRATVDTKSMHRELAKNDDAMAKSADESQSGRSAFFIGKR
jgi:hypothetical protein